jgi:hypothetical protein
LVLKKKTGAVPVLGWVVQNIKIPVSVLIVRPSSAKPGPKLAV